MRFAPDHSASQNVIKPDPFTEADSFRARWSFRHVDARVAAMMRTEITSFLRARAGRGTDLFEASLAIGELLGNVARHAPGEADIWVDWSEIFPVLTVGDRGCGLDVPPGPQPPCDIYDESGRGLLMIAHLVRRFEIRAREGGGVLAEIELDVARPDFQGA